MKFPLMNGTYGNRCGLGLGSLLQARGAGALAHQIEADFNAGRLDAMRGSSRWE